MRGSRAGNSKLTEQDVLEIRRLEGIKKRSAVAAQFGLNVWHVRDIQKRKVWQHI